MYIFMFVLCEQKGFTALHISAKYGTVRVARVMIKMGADVNIAGKNGLTPLHVASHYNHPAMVTLLLTSKASPHSTAKVSNFVFTALVFCCLMVVIMWQVLEKRFC